MPDTSQLVGQSWHPSVKHTPWRAPRPTWSTPSLVWLLYAFAFAFAVTLGLLAAGGGGDLALLLALSVGLIVAGLTDFRIAVFALVMMFPLTSTYYFPRKLFGVTGLNPFNLLLLLTLIGFSIQRLFTNRNAQAPLPRVIFFWPIVLPIGAAAIIGSSSIHQIPAFYHLESELFTTKPMYFRDVLLKPLLTLTFVYLLGAAVACSRRVAIWIWALLGAGATLALLVLAFVLSSGRSIGALSDASARSFLSSTGLHANEMGVALLPLFSIALFLVPALPITRARVAAACFVMLALPAIILTFSRAAFVGVVVVGVVFSIRRRRVVWVFMCLLMVMVAVLFSPGPVRERVMRGFDTASVGGRNSEADPLTAGRVGGIWKPLLPDIQEHIVLGNGIHSTMWSSAARSGQIVVAHPHNAYIRLLLDYGVVFGVFVVLFLVRVWHLWRQLAQNHRLQPTLRAFFDGISVSFLAFLIQCMSGSSLSFGVEHAVYLSSIGLALGVNARLTDATTPAQCNSARCGTKTRVNE